jgi:cytoplasmic iron level regulating protein YaaA (DUF328/UPF0246 family)
MTILLPPSEGKASGGRRPGWSPSSGRFGRRLGGNRSLVAESLAELGGGDRRLLGVGGDTLTAARQANCSLVGAPVLPAWQRYSGVVWRHLDIPSLDPPTRRRARGAVLVVSAVTGVSGLADPLPEHRLKLSVSLPGLGRLDRWWRPQVSDTLDRALRGRLVIDLLPNEHRAAWQPDPDRFELRRITLRSDAGAAVGHGAKAAKGLLARALLESDDPDRLLGTWSAEGLHASVT